MAVQEVNSTYAEAMLATMQRIEVTLQALPDELAASRVTTLSDTEAKEILAKRYARINHYQKEDEHALKGHRQGQIANYMLYAACVAGVIYFLVKFGS